jgi:small conductance mechanosensitive channel
VGTLSTLIASLIRYGAVLIAFCWGLTIIGVNVSTVFASVSIIAMILTFGAQSLVADLVTGVFIIFENQYNVGDIIEVSGFRGTVQEIGFRTISLVDAGGNTKIISNSNVIDVVNLSDNQSVAICEIGVSYSTDLEALETKLPEIFVGIKEKYRDVFIGDIKYLGVEELADSCVKLKIKADVNENNLYSGRRILNKELKMAFDREKIEIPFPQMDVLTIYANRRGVLWNIEQMKKCIFRRNMHRVRKNTIRRQRKPSKDPQKRMRTAGKPHCFKN